MEDWLSDMSKSNQGSPRSPPESEPLKPTSRIEELFGPVVRQYGSHLTVSSGPASARRALVRPTEAELDKPVSPFDTCFKLEEVARRPHTQGEDIRSPGERDLGLIPDWFHVLDMADKIQLRGDDAEERFHCLRKLIVSLESSIDQTKYEQEAAARGEPTTNPLWDKNWHDPSPWWSNPHRQANGGWWKCRQDVEAPIAELVCRVCRDAPPLSPGSWKRANEKKHAQIDYDYVMGAIDWAMKRVAEKDKLTLERRVREGRLFDDD